MLDGDGLPQDLLCPFVTRGFFGLPGKELARVEMGSGQKSSLDFFDDM